MARENDRRAVLENLTATLGQALALGLGDLPAEKRAQLDHAIDQGWRVEFVIRLAPLHLRCFAAAPDLQTRALIFEVQTGDAPGPGDVH